MNWDEIKGSWRQLKGDVKQRWGKLTDDDLDQIEGSRDKFVGKIQERYGKAKTEVEREVDDFCRTCEPKAYRT